MHIHFIMPLETCTCVTCFYISNIIYVYMWESEWKVDIGNGFNDSLENDPPPYEEGKRNEKRGSGWKKLRNLKKKKKTLLFFIMKCLLYLCCFYLKVYFIYLFIYLFIFLFRTTAVGYGRSQARGQIGAVAASLHHSHSNMGSKPNLWPTPQLIATPDP